jgi:hypothetical protein
MKPYKTKALLILALGLLIAGIAHADTVIGVPVTAIASTTLAVPACPASEGLSCYNPTTGQTNFFIPLSSSNSGVFGVTPHSGGTAGTFVDSGFGTSNALTMYLMFSPVNLPVLSASLTFDFIDLDLAGVNDPANFWEAIRFYSAAGIALTPWITANGQSGGGLLNYTVTGNTYGQTIFFPDVTSILQNPFYIQLNFSSLYKSSSKGKNTIESLTPILSYTPVPPPPPPPVPEPASLVLFGSGLIAVGQLVRLRNKRSS